MFTLRTVTEKSIANSRDLVYKGILAASLEVEAAFIKKILKNA